MSPKESGTSKSCQLKRIPTVLCPLTSLHITEAVFWPHTHLRQDMRSALEKESSPTQAKGILSGLTKRSSWGKPAVSRDGVEMLRRAWRLGKVYTRDEG